MPHRRHGRLARALAVALGLALVAGLTYLVLKKHHEHAVEAARDPVFPTVHAKPTATPRPKSRHRHPRVAASASDAPAPSTGAPGGLLSQLGSPNGLQGNGHTDSLPRHQLTVTITSGHALGRAYYVIPTSPAYRRGSAAVPGTRWSLHTTVWGKPKYAVAGAQADVTGTAVTCTISVDGHVTDRRTTKGPYSVVWCVG